LTHEYWVYGESFYTYAFVQNYDISKLKTPPLILYLVLLLFSLEEENASLQQKLTQLPELELRVNSLSEICETDTVLIKDLKKEASQHVPENNIFQV